MPWWDPQVFQLTPPEGATRRIDVGGTTSHCLHLSEWRNWLPELWERWISSYRCLFWMLLNHGLPQGPCTSFPFSIFESGDGKDQLPTRCSEARLAILVRIHWTRCRKVRTMPYMVASRNWTKSSVHQRAWLVGKISWVALRDKQWELRQSEVSTPFLFFHGRGTNLASRWQRSDPEISRRKTNWNRCEENCGSRGWADRGSRPPGLEDKLKRKKIRSKSFQVFSKDDPKNAKAKDFWMKKLKVGFFDVYQRNLWNLIINGWISHRLTPLIQITQSF